MTVSPPPPPHSPSPSTGSTARHTSRNGSVATTPSGDRTRDARAPRAANSEAEEGGGIAREKAGTRVGGLSLFFFFFLPPLFFPPAPKHTDTPWSTWPPTTWCVCWRGGRGGDKGVGGRRNTHWRRPFCGGSSAGQPPRARWPRRSASTHRPPHAGTPDARDEGERETAGGRTALPGPAPMPHAARAPPPTLTASSPLPSLSLFPPLCSLAEVRLHQPAAGPSARLGLPHRRRVGRVPARLPRHRPAGPLPPLGVLLRPLRRRPRGGRARAVARVRVGGRAQGDAGHARAAGGGAGVRGDGAAGGGGGGAE